MAGVLDTAGSLRSTIETDAARHDPLSCYREAFRELDRRTTGVIHDGGDSTVLPAILLLGERLRPWQVAGAVLVVTAVLLVQRRGDDACEARTG